MTKVKEVIQAKWNEPCNFEMGRKGTRGHLVPKVDDKVKASLRNVKTSIPKKLRREGPPLLPELSEVEVMRHFLRLSQESTCVDSGFNGEGTCTMKYNPKINEVFASSGKAADLHPDQDERTVQGALRIMYELDLFLREISGLDRFTLQPSSGSHAILAMASIVRKFHETRGEGDKRDEIITTIFSHPSDAAAAAVKGYKVVTIYYDKTGLPDIESLKKAVSGRTAALFITNPEDTGIFNPRIAEFTRTVHEAGGLCGYDQANANGILGVTRAKEAGFDMCFFNLHKTFGTPHGCGGPASGALGVSKALVDFLPVPIVEYDGKSYSLNWDLPHTIGKVRAFYGAFPAILKAYAWIMSLGAAGLKEVAHIAVLNNNYLLKKITEIPGATAPFAAGKRRIEQVRYSWEELTKETGVDTHQFSLRMADFGFHLCSSHHPFLVPQPFTIEPTESYSKEELDEYVDGLRHVAEEARLEPEIVKNAPHRSVVHKIDESTFDDPAKWAITWRAYRKKHGNPAAEGGTK